MANWSNVRLIVLGRKRAVAQFSEKARSRPRDTFRSDMLVGEAQGLQTERMRYSHEDLYRKDFRFQARNDDGLQHFGQVSKRHRSLRFVLVYADPNTGDYGSYLIVHGEIKQYRIPDKVQLAIMHKHHALDNDDDSDVGFWEASTELMEIAEARWIGPKARPS